MDPVRLSETVLVHRLVFEVRALDPIRLPDFAGSMLRGAYGHALRRLACMTGAKLCAGCGLAQLCPYPALFEPSIRVLTTPRGGAPPPPFAIEPPDAERKIAPGEKWRFGLRLFGDRIASLALIIEAVRRAVSRGLGTALARGLLTDVWLDTGEGWRSVYDAASGAVAPPEADAAWRPAAPDAAAAIALALLTPLRVQSNGRRLPPAEITVRRLTLDILRRARALLGVCGTAEQQAAAAAWPIEHYLEAADACAITHELKWFDWTRASSRQNRTINHGGWLGQLVVHAQAQPELPARVLDALALGAKIGIGKECVFGFGQYALKPVA
ncbi:MAG: CRISPR system precrRNA processing endoribonuclease RAMP protein Cas6 [Phreatobacter sp.]